MTGTIFDGPRHARDFEIVQSILDDPSQGFTGIKKTIVDLRKREYLSLRSRLLRHWWERLNVVFRGGAISQDLKDRVVATYYALLKTEAQISYEVVCYLFGRVGVEIIYSDSAEPEPLELFTAEFCVRRDSIIAVSESLKNKTQAVINYPARANKPKRVARVDRKVRHGPVTGYGFREKNDYRNAVWSVFAEYLNLDTAKVALLPGEEGMEIPVALSHGIRAENLYAIEQDPVAIMQRRHRWRVEFPTIKFLGSTAARALHRLAKQNVKIDGANLDFCNKLSPQLIRELQEIASSGAFNNNAAIAVTIMRGREDREHSAIASLLARHVDGDFDDPRFAAVVDALSSGLGHLRVIAQGKYQSTVPMAWIVVQRCAV